MVASPSDRVDPVESVDSWQIYLLETAHRLRAAVAMDPDVLYGLASPSGTTWWLRPPVGDLVLVEEFLSEMRHYGFSNEDAAATYLAFFTFLLGQLCLQATGSPSPPAGPAADLSAYPTLSRLRPLLSVNRDTDEFECALEDVLTRLERELRR